MNTAAFGSRSLATSPFTFTINDSPDVNRLAQHDFRQDGLHKSVGYDRIAQDLRTALRDDDVEMEDASDWPTSWENSDDEPESRGREGETFNQHPESGNHSQPLTTSGEEAPRLLYIALDTNIFISHLKTVQAIHERLSRTNMPHQKQPPERPQERTIKLLVPNIVIHELDKQKNLRKTHAKSPAQQNGPEGAANRSLLDSQHAKPAFINSSNRTSPHALAAAARSAIEWLLQIRQAQRRGGSDHTTAQLWVFQKKGEVVNEDIILSKADDRILDCCEYYQNDIHNFSRTNDVILWTDDKNLSLQAEIHDITCIGNRAFSAEQVLTIAQETLAAHLSKLPSPSAAPQITTDVAPQMALSQKTVTLKRTPPKRQHAATPASNKKSSSRGITSSIWARTAHTGRNCKTNGSNGKARASSLPLLSDHSTTGSLSQRPFHQHDSSTTASPQKTANKTPPRLADALTIITTTPYSPSTLDIALGHILAFPLYDLLLEQVCRNQPAVLRQFLGPADLGPGHWNGNDCLTLLRRGWEFGLHSTYLANPADAFAVPPQASFEALSWLQAFLAHHQEISKLASRKDTAPTWPSGQDRMRAIEAIRILFIRNRNQWWLDDQHLQVMERLIEWLGSVA